MRTKKEYQSVSFRLIELESKEIDMLSASGEGGDVDVSMKDFLS